LGWGFQSLISMSIREKTNFVIYRIGKKGLEILLVNKNQQGNEHWQFPKGQLNTEAVAVALEQEDCLTELDMALSDKGINEKNVAVEADWHEIPSLKSLLSEDVEFAKETLRQLLPDMMEKGAFFAVKEAFKKVLPTQYETIKELKEIITDRNSTKYM
jgi:hypothetical protein